MSAELSLDRALHAIADPTRRRILLVLKESRRNPDPASPRNGPDPCLCGGDIEERMRLSQPTISHHMAILTRSGLVEVTKRGQWRWYHRNEKAIRQLVRLLRGKL